MSFADTLAKAEFQRHRERVRRAQPYVRSRIEHVYKLKKKEKAPKGKNLDPKWTHSYQHKIDLENQRLVHTFQNILKEKQMDDRLRRPTFDIQQNAYKARMFLQKRIEKDNERMCKNIMNARSSYPAARFAKEHQDRMTAQVKRTASIGAGFSRPSTAMQSEFSRTYSRLRKRTTSFPITDRASPSRPFTAPAWNFSDSKTRPLESVSLEEVSIDGEQFSFEAKITNRPPKLDMVLHQNGTKRPFKIIVPWVHIESCFRAFPRLLAPENFRELVSFILDFFVCEQDEVSLDLSPVARLGKRIIKESGPKSKARNRGGKKGLGGKKSRRPFSQQSSLRKSYDQGDSLRRLSYSSRANDDIPSRPATTQSHRKGSRNGEDMRSFHRSVDSKGKTSTAEFMVIDEARSLDY